MIEGKDNKCFPNIKKMWLLPVDCFSEEGIPDLDSIKKAVAEGKATEVDLTKSKDPFSINILSPEAEPFFDKLFGRENQPPRIDPVRFELFTKCAWCGKLSKKTHCSEECKESEKQSLLK